MDLMVVGISKAITTMSSDMPKTLGYSWEGRVRQRRNLLFQDALGRSIVLPWILCMEEKVRTTKLLPEIYLCAIFGLRISVRF
jgi:hypothetical protein